MGWSNNSVFQVLIVTGSTGSGVFVYSPSPGFGSLVASVAAVGGTDPYGNAYLPGVASYLPSGAPPLAVALAAGQLRFNSAATAAGPWSLGTSVNVSIGADGIAQILNINPQGLVANAVTNILGALNVNGGLLTALNGAQINNGGAVTGGLSWLGDATGDRLTLTRAGGAPLLEVDNTLNAGTASIRVKTLLNLVQQVGFSLLGTTDTNGRLTLNLDASNNPRISMGPGTGAPDAIFYRASPALFAANDIAADAGGVAETWNAVTFANGWANAGLEPGMQFRQVAAPDNCVQVVGAITVPVGFVAGQNITTAMPAAYRPAKTNELTVYNANTNAPARITVTTGGIFQYQAGGNAAGNSLIIPAGNLIALTA